MKSIKEKIQKIMAFGHANPGCGHSCSLMAKKAVEDFDVAWAELEDVLEWLVLSEKAHAHPKCLNYQSNPAHQQYIARAEAIVGHEVTEE